MINIFLLNNKQKNSNECIFYSSNGKKKNYITEQIFFQNGVSSSSDSEESES